MFQFVWLLVALMYLPLVELNCVKVLMKVWFEQKKTQQREHKQAFITSTKKICSELKHNWKAFLQMIVEVYWDTASKSEYIFSRMCYRVYVGCNSYLDRYVYILLDSFEFISYICVHIWKQCNNILHNSISLKPIPSSVSLTKKPATPSKLGKKEIKKEIRGLMPMRVSWNLWLICSQKKTIMLPCFKTFCLGSAESRFGFQVL